MDSDFRSDMKSLLVRCSVTALSNSAARWGIQTSKGISLLPASLKMENLHEMKWTHIQKIAEEHVGKDEVQFHPLYDSRPDKIVAVGLNYADHCTEQNVVVERLPKDPIIFNKVNDSLNFRGNFLV